MYGWLAPETDLSESGAFKGHQDTAKVSVNSL